jgi:hypothetical protein
MFDKGKRNDYLRNLEIQQVIKVIKRQGNLQKKP